MRKRLIGATSKQASRPDHVSRYAFSVDGWAILWQVCCIQMERTNGYER